MFVLCLIIASRIGLNIKKMRIKPPTETIPPLTLHKQYSDQNLSTCVDLKHLEFFSHSMVFNGHPMTAEPRAVLTRSLLCRFPCHLLLQQVCHLSGSYKHKSHDGKTVTYNTSSQYNCCRVYTFTMTTR